MANFKVGDIVRGAHPIKDDTGWDTGVVAVVVKENSYRDQVKVLILQDKISPSDTGTAYYVYPLDLEKMENSRFIRLLYV